MREELKVLKLEGNVIDMKKVKSQLSLSVKALRKRRSNWKRNL